MKTLTHTISNPCFKCGNKINNMYCWSVVAICENCKTFIRNGFNNGQKGLGPKNGIDYNIKENLR